MFLFWEKLRKHLILKAILQYRNITTARFKEIQVEIKEH